MVGIGRPSSNMEEVRSKTCDFCDVLLGPSAFDDSANFQAQYVFQGVSGMCSIDV